MGIHVAALRPKRKIWLNALEQREPVPVFPTANPDDARESGEPHHRAAHARGPELGEV